MSKVLIIEDDPILREMYKDQFEKDGFEVILSEDAKNGVITAVKESPDFILLDIMMPMQEQMNGITAFKHLKEMPETKSIPTAFLTVVPEGVPQSIDKNPQLLQEATAYWRKDKFTPKQIVENVKELLEKNH